MPAGDQGGAIAALQQERCTYFASKAFALATCCVSAASAFWLSLESLSLAADTQASSAATLARIDDTAALCNDTLGCSKATASLIMDSGF